MKRHLFGTHPVEEALRANAQGIASLFVLDERPQGPHGALLERARRAGVSVQVVEPAVLDRWAKGVKHQGVAAVAAGEYPYANWEEVLAAQPTLMVALDQLTDVHNVGAIVRSGVALGAEAFVLLKDRAAPITPQVVRAAAGATEHARIARVTNLSRALEECTEQGYTSVGLDMEGERSLEEVDLRGPTVLVVGSEGSGLRRLVRERCTVRARIPMSGALGSLNASVAAAIALYETHRQRRAVATTTA